MREWKSQSHVKWYCKYHIVFSPKYRKKAMFGSLRKGVGKILRELCNHPNLAEQPRKPTVFAGPRCLPELLQHSCARCGRFLGQLCFYEMTNTVVRCRDPLRFGNPGVPLSEFAVPRP